MTRIEAERCLDRIQKLPIHQPAKIDFDGTWAIILTDTQAWLYTEKRVAEMILFIYRPQDSK